MLTKIKIEGLFGKFNYEIELKKDGITILTGPNGYGKTTILKILHAFAAKNLVFFFLLPFTEIILIQENNPIRISKKNDMLEIQSADETPICYKRGEIIPDDIGPLIESFQYNQIDENRWEDSIGAVYSTENLMVQVIENNPGNPAKHNKKQLPDFVDVYLIGEQRLIRKITSIRRSISPYIKYDMKESFSSVIEEYAMKLANSIKDILASASKIGQELDSSFPRRLFDETRELGEDEFNVRYNKIKEKQKFLSLFGLAAGKEENQPSYKGENAKALLVYLDDTEKKLAVFDEILPKLEILSSIINEKLFAFKKLEISPDFGFRFHADDGQVLSLTNLSSGEQQEVVLLYELLFQSSPNTLVLIDEPELSLHVAWQKEVLNDLMKIIALKKITVIMATHSPQIIGNHWDLEVDLWDILK